MFLFSCFPTAPPNTLNFNGAHRKRKTLVAPEINISLDQSEGSLLSDDFLDTPDDLDINVDDIETPDETDSLEFLGNGNELEWEGELSLLVAPARPQMALRAPAGFLGQLTRAVPPPTGSGRAGVPTQGSRNTPRRVHLPLQLHAYFSCKLADFSGGTRLSLGSRR